MKGWWRSPSGQLNDPRCAKLSLAARGLLWSLSDVADGRGAVPLGAMTLDEVLLAVSGRDPEEPVRAAWLELHRVRLAYVEGGVIALDLPEPDVSQPETFAGPSEVAGEVTTRPDKAVAVKRLRALLSKLVLKTAEARTAWLESEHGGKALERLGLTPEDGRAVVETTGRRGRPVTIKKVTSDDGMVTEKVTEKVATVSPAPPSGEKDTEKEAADSARAGMVTETVTGPRETVAQTVPETVTPRLSSRESTVVRVTATEVLFTLRTDGGLRLSAGPVQENELDGVLQGVTPVWTLDGTRHLARHIKAGHLRDGWRPSIAHLRGRDGSWTTLLSLYDEAQTCERCAQTRPATVAHKPAVKTVENSAKPRLPPEEIRARALKVIEEIQQRKGKK